MYELPPDLERLRVIRTYLHLQLAAVDAKIEQAERPVARPGADRPPQAWRLQHIPNPDGGAGRGVVHRDRCRIKGGGWIDRKELELALTLPEVTACGDCHPERGLEP
ncbi:hypothetical protein [Actinacidiphila soli]|jgi:hypothetical protein|uniref:hypothetical protein n=1 Tax=Actinacidiphila soli TaxID=2487275 RepID=UPI000FC9F545|nr:hypothetical protein [Actinacidiphila soli]